MKNYVVILVVAAALAGVLSTGGCVSQDQYNEALTLNRKLQDDLKQTEDQIRALKEERQAMETAVQERDGEINSRQKEIENLTQARDELNISLAALKGKYDELLKDFKLQQPGPLPLKVDAALKALAQASPELLEYQPQYGMLKLKSDFTFDKGSAEVKPGAAVALQKLAGIVNTAEAGTFNVYVAGHTDDIPLKRAPTIDKYGTNWGLSTARAIVVIDVLAKAGVAEPRMGAIGFGEFHPVAENAQGKRGNPLNRRVEIWIVPPNRFLTQDGPKVSSGAEPK
ncbi:MAG TPA: OmpA family protein [Phycisphaerae bacterium]|nr:OmpA family protein [Phycisphaerae bacterium]